MKKIVILFMLFVSVTVAQEKPTPADKPYYKFLGNGKWGTNTSAVKLADKNIEEIKTLRTDIEEYKTQLEMYKAAYDSAREIIATDKEIIKKKDEIIFSKIDLINEITKPVEVEIPSPPFIKFSGIYFNVGTEYDNREKFEVNVLRYFISAEASLIFKDRIKLTGEQKYPVYSSLKLGVVF